MILQSDRNEHLCVLDSSPKHTICSNIYPKFSLIFKMACGSGTTGNETAQKFLETLQNDLKNLSIETKKKFPQIKEVS